jgi:protein regulator of cytokinesis 1
VFRFESICFTAGHTIENIQSMQPEKTTGTIKQQLAAIAPTLEQLTKQKNERKREFVNVQSQIDQICGEIAGTIEVGEQVTTPQVNEDDLTLERLEDFRSQLQELEKEKVFFYLLPFYWL